MGLIEPLHGDRRDGIDVGLAFDQQLDQANVPFERREVQW